MFNLVIFVYLFTLPTHTIQSPFQLAFSTSSPDVRVYRFSLLGHYIGPAEVSGPLSLLIFEPREKSNKQQSSFLKSED